MICRLFAGAVLAACVACDSNTPSDHLSFTSATLIANTLEQVDAALATPPLQSLGALATPMRILGIDVHNIDSTILGRTIIYDIIQGRLNVSNRTGAPANAMRLILYQKDSTGRPAYPFVEVGYADFYPFNEHNGGGPDSMSLRFIVTDTRTTPTVVADFIAHHHATTCQCATLDGWASDGTTRVDFTVPYQIDTLGPGLFPGEIHTTAPALLFEHVAVLPGPNVSTANAGVQVYFNGDLITTTSLLRARRGRLEGTSEMSINAHVFATVTRDSSGISAHRPDGRPLTDVELGAVSAIFRVQADLAYFIEWPVFVVFFCGC